MNSRILAFLLAPVFAVLSAPAAEAGAAQSKPRDLNTPRDFPQISSRQQWEQRAHSIREQVLVSCGLWPMPARTPLHPQVFGKIDRDGYSVEKVYLETLPGFYLGGNLYRPLGRGKGPFPGVLNPHGHWSNGRLADTKDGSIPARCISFARQGMVAFSYDMVGYNDTQFAKDAKGTARGHRQFATNQVNQLWSISLMGLQTWDSIRALDFLASLPDVDPKRLACTGESGGGTQTFMLGSIEDRLAAQAPVVMVSHTMQGGCLCENAPGLRVEYSNMELAAAAAPRPQLLVAATGDWTKDTLTVEGPSIAGIYQLLNARDRFDFVQFDFGHNYNQTSREAVYAWFDRWLLGHPAAAALKEAPCQKEADADLQVFPDGQLPAGTLTAEQLIARLRQQHREQWQALAPRSKGSLKRYKEVYATAWRHTLQLDWPAPAPQVSADNMTVSGEFTTATLNIRREAGAPVIPTTYWAPANILKAKAPRVVVLCLPAAEGASDSGLWTLDSAQPSGLTLECLRRGLAVLALRAAKAADAQDQFANFYTTYNRTEVQQRVRDIAAVCAAARSADPRKTLKFEVILCGSGRAGLWSLLAAPVAHALVADCVELDVSRDETLLAQDLFCPGLLAIGGFEGAALLAAPKALLVHDTGARFATEGLRSGYKGIGAERTLRVEAGALGDAAIADWAAQTK